VGQSAQSCPCQDERGKLPRSSEGPELLYLQATGTRGVGQASLATRGLRAKFGGCGPGFGLPEVPRVLQRAWGIVFF